MSPVVRNVLIVLAIAAVIAIAPGGGTGAQVVIQAASLAFLGAAAWVASIMYRENRERLYMMGDKRRAILYGSGAALAVTLTATSRMWNSSAGSVLWLLIVIGAVYLGAWVIWSARQY